jgi:hypothetical protein
MINLPCDEAYAFDYLAILYVKKSRKLRVDSEIKAVESALQEQVPAFFSIMDSHQFFVLIKANESVFDAVAQSQNSPTQIANRCRYRAKKALQRRFWKSLPLTERKTKAEQ